MSYIGLLLIVISCTAAQQCADSSNKHLYSKATYRVSDEDFESLFTDAVVTTSSIYCVTFCITNRTDSYFENNTRRCRCQASCASYDPVSIGTNFVEKHYIPSTSKLLRTQSKMSSFSSFRDAGIIIIIIKCLLIDSKSIIIHC